MSKIKAVDFSKIIDQEHVKRAIEISVAGKHNLLIIGTKGSGLTTMIKSVGSLMDKTAFVNPLNSKADLVKAVKEKSNILIDDLHNYPASTLKLLKYAKNECYMVAATLTCPCGHYNDLTTPCTCTVSKILKFKQSIPMDAFDIIIEMMSPRSRDLSRAYKGETSKDALSRIKAMSHYTPLTLDEPSRSLLDSAVQRLGISVKTYETIKQVARTIANLDHGEFIKAHHVAEAIQYRASFETVQL
jgi:magnesium chelatase family protein